MKKALIYGILGSFFFAFTFLLNRSMNLAGGFWLWSAALRYLYTLPILALVLLKQRALGPILKEIGRKPGFWLLWSTVGFGLFYVPMSFASAHGESWLIASTWQITIVSGVLLTPLFGRPLPKKNLALSCLILAGIFLMQSAHIQAEGLSGLGSVIVPVLVASFAYPLGNRMTMAHCPGGITSTQRIFGMTLCSIPFWLVCSVIAFVRSGLPGTGQNVQSFMVALFSGVIATRLFFGATDLVRDNPKQLALIEATQCGEVVFTLLGGILLLGDALPTAAGFAGIALILAGMVLSSLVVTVQGRAAHSLRGCWRT